MSNTAVYSLMYVLAEGQLLSQHGSATLSRSTNSQPVNTVALGYAGESPGAPMVEFDCECAVPATGFERQWGPEMAALIPAEIGVLMAGQQIRMKGFIISDTFAHSVNSEAKYSFKFRGGPADFE